MRSKFILVLALLMGGITTYLFFSWMNEQEVETVTPENMVDVVVATQTIQPHQRITAAMLETKSVPQMGLHSQSIHQIADAQGKFATAEISEGEILLSHRVQDEQEERLFVSRKVQEGYRAVSVGVSFVRSVSTLIEPEDLVDVIVTEEVETSVESENFASSNDEIISAVILEEVRVLAVDRRMIELTSAEQYVEYNAVTLELTQEDAVRLINANERGTVQLILHGKEEHIEDEQSDE